MKHLFALTYDFYLLDEKLSFNKDSLLFALKLKLQGQLIFDVKYLTNVMQITGKARSYFICDFVHNECTGRFQFKIRKFSTLSKFCYVGDFMMMTDSRCWWHNQNVGST